jgi:signal peptidase II
VIDFIYVKLIDFPVFNVADICVTAGCALIVLSLLTERGASGTPERS